MPDSNPVEILGGCVCGGTRYALTATPIGLSDCHCVDCRRSSAAPYVTWGSVPASALRILQGETRRVPHAARFRFFAACCGTPLFFRDAEDSAWIDVTIGSLDEPAAFPPEKSVWTEDKLPWLQLDPRLPAYPRLKTDAPR
jgi:hypothetical protein